MRWLEKIRYLKFLQTATKCDFAGKRPYIALVDYNLIEFLDLTNPSSKDLPVRSYK